MSKAAFFDELEKIAVSRERLRVVAQGRSGIRPISVDKLLEKDKAGTLYKKAGDWGGSPVAVDMGIIDMASARRPRKPGDVPSQDDTDKIDREDSRENAVTTTGQGSTFNNVAATGNSAGGT